MPEQRLTEEGVARRIADTVAVHALHNWHWEVMGFKSVPRRGSWFNRFVPKERRTKEEFLLRELAVATISTGAHVVARECSPPAAARVTAWIIQSLCEAEGVPESFRFSSAEDLGVHLVKGVRSYSTSRDASSLASTFLRRAAASLGEALSGGWLLGISRIFAEPGAPFETYVAGLESVLRGRTLFCDLEDSELSRRFE